MGFFSGVTVSQTQQPARRALDRRADRSCLPALETCAVIWRLTCPIRATPCQDTFVSACLISIEVMVSCVLLLRQYADTVFLIYTRGGDVLYVCGEGRELCSHEQAFQCITGNSLCARIPMCLLVLCTVHVPRCFLLEVRNVSPSIVVHYDGAPILSCTF